MEKTDSDDVGLPSVLCWNAGDWLLDHSNDRNVCIYLAVKRR